MRVLICGSRDFSNPTAIESLINSLSRKYTTIIHGAAQGADTMAGRFAKQQGLEVLAFPAEWGRYGKAAGTIRNKQMLVEGKPDIVYAFYNIKKLSKGTANMVAQAKKAGIPVVEYEEYTPQGERQLK